jgi:hypothetical protein
MKKGFAVSFVVLSVVSLMMSCSKQSDTFTSSTVPEYFPLSVGKYFIYRLDSTLPANFGTSLAVRSYQAKDSVIATFVDNLGRPSYTIFRYLRDTAALKPWTYSSTMYATATDGALEYVDNNLRFLKLRAPISNGFSWYGHSFIDTHNQANAFLDKANGWNYTYQNVGEPYTVFNTTYDTTAVVAQIDDTTPAGPFDPTLPIQVRTFGMEVYAKNVGLIYKDLLFWNWQSSPSGHFQDESFGIRLRLISHN